MRNYVIRSFDSCRPHRVIAREQLAMFAFVDGIFFISSSVENKILYKKEYIYIANTSHVPDATKKR